MTPQTQDGDRLALPPVEEIARDLEGSAGEGASASADDDATLEAQADAFVEALLDDGDAEAQARQRRAVDELGLELQQQAAHQSAMLQTPLRQLAHHGDEGGPVAKALVDLRGRMQSLDPARHNLEDRAQHVLQPFGRDLHAGASRASASAVASSRSTLPWLPRGMRSTVTTSRGRR